MRPPNDFSPRTQTGATYDISVGEGRRVWQECLATAALDLQQLVAPAPSASTGPRYGAPTLHQPRLGQGIFRVQVLDAYGRACAVTGEHSLPVLEAAHIKPYAKGGEHDIANGLSLRTDIHRLFDKGYVTVDEESKFVVGRRLKQDFENGRSYYSLAGRTLELPAEAARRPSEQGAGLASGERLPRVSGRVPVTTSWQGVGP